MRLWRREQESNQVRHLLDGDGGFQALRHQREAGASNRGDVAAEDRFDYTVGALQCEDSFCLSFHDVEVRVATSAADDITEIARHKSVRPPARICRAQISGRFFLGTWNPRAAGDSHKRTTRGSKKASVF